MSQMIFSPMSTSTYYLSIKHNWQQVSIGPDSIPTSYTWSTGTPPGPLMLIIHIKRSEIKGIFTHDTSSYFLGISGNTWTFGSGSIPASYKWSTGTLPGPMVFNNDIKGSLHSWYIKRLLRYNWQRVITGQGSIPASHTLPTGALHGPMVFFKDVRHDELYIHPWYINLLLRRNWQ